MGEIALIVKGNSLRIPLANGSVHCVVTSPPYWALRDYGVNDQLGLEETPEIYIEKISDVFDEVFRVLRDDGTLWLNIGDTYISSGGSGVGGNTGRRGRTYQQKGIIKTCAGSLPVGNLAAIPWRVALSLQNRGWILRSEVIWHKRNPMAESVGNRPTRSHEQVFLFTKSLDYFYDWFSVMEKTTGNAHGRGHGINPKASENAPGSRQNERYARNVSGLVEMRRLRTVWTLSGEPFTGAHFAAFPSRLVLPCIKAGSSERGCCARCGAPWIRKVQKERFATRPGESSKAIGATNAERGNRDPERHVTRYKSIGWNPSCECGEVQTVPAVVLDPFCGSGTTPTVADGIGRRSIAIDLSYEYCRMALDRTRRPHRKRPRKSGDLPLFDR